MKTKILSLLFVGAMFLGASRGKAQTFAIDSFTVAGGSGSGSGGIYSLSGTVGQADGSMELTGGEFSLSGGFWSVVGGFPGSVVIFDNTGGDANGYESATTNAWLANKICLGAQPYQLDAVTLSLVSGDANGDPRVRVVQLHIYANDPDTDRPALDTGVTMDLLGVTNPIPLAISYIENPITWVPETPFLLASNTCYWVVLSTDDGDVGEVATFSTPTGDAASFGRALSADAGATWQAPDPGSNRKMLVRGSPTIIPPPAPDLVISAVEIIGNDLRLSFATVAGKNYAIQSSPDLSSGSWTTLPGPANTGIDGILQVTIPDALTEPQQFYRIQVVP